MKLTVKKINSVLFNVMDPELHISIADMGLIYKVSLQKDKVKILMTLTTIGCPLISTIEEDIKNQLENIGVKRKNITIDLTFDPPWTMEKMSKKAKAKLGI